MLKYKAKINHPKKKKAKEKQLMHESKIKRIQNKNIDKSTRNKTAAYFWVMFRLNHMHCSRNPPTYYGDFSSQPH